MSGNILLCTLRDVSTWKFWCHFMIWRMNRDKIPDYPPSTFIFTAGGGTQTHLTAFTGSNLEFQAQETTAFRMTVWCFKMLTAITFCSVILNLLTWIMDYDFILYHGIKYSWKWCKVWKCYHSFNHSCHKNINEQNYFKNL